MEHGACAKPPDESFYQTSTLFTLIRRFRLILATCRGAFKVFLPPTHRKAHVITVNTLLACAIWISITLWEYVVFPIILSVLWIGTIVSDDLSAKRQPNGD